MPYTQHLSRTWIEKLMEISTALGDYTHNAEECQKIPGYLRLVLDVGAVTVGVLASQVDLPEVALLATSLNSTTMAVGLVESEVLALYRALRSMPTDSLNTYPMGTQANSEVTRFSAPMNFPNFPMAVVYGQQMAEGHYMVLILHQQGTSAEIPQDVRDMTLLIACQLSKLLRCMVACNAGSQILGGRFDRLTDREWAVLRVLNSDDGEKQLADRLSLSPHTLHSHIKSIYRKVGVQGRLSLLLRLREAQQDLRVATLITPQTARSHEFAMN
jgi:DNA-binding CsgD family transcriptional regulator